MTFCFCGLIECQEINVTDWETGKRTKYYVRSEQVKAAKRDIQRARRNDAASALELSKIKYDGVQQNQKRQLICGNSGTNTCGSRREARR